VKFLDLFAGIGGFRLGMEQAGHECVGYVEWDKYARKSYEAIHNTEGEWSAHDITTVTDGDLEFLRGKGIDVICGGFPCQAFSVAGKRGGFDDTRGTMFFEIARFAKQIKPRLLLLENVKGLLSHDKGNTFGTILHTLDELGYDCEWQVLNSKNFGVPQNRERIFVVGHLRGFGRREVFPIGGTDGEVDIPVKLVAHRKNYHRNTQVFSPDGITETLDTGQGGGRGHYTIIDDQGRTTKQLQPKEICPTLRAQSHGNEPKVVMPILTPDREEKRQNGRRVKEDGEPMFTLTAQDRHGIVLTRKEIKGTTDTSHCLMARDYKGIGNQEMTAVKEGIRIRKLTPRECWRLQSFPDWAFDKAEEVNSDSQLYKQAGNSVTVNVVFEIAKRLG
jgi:DNA (cytosine-5)-methyltransferase 1